MVMSAKSSGSRYVVMAHSAWTCAPASYTTMCADIRGAPYAAGLRASPEEAITIFFVPKKP